MARQLWLLRHADAEPHGARLDSERRLTERGKLQAQLAGRALARMGVAFEAMFTSPKERALHTASLAGEAWEEAVGAGVGEIATDSVLADGLDAIAVRNLMGSLSAEGRLLLVGHEPDFSDVVRELTGALIELKKGGVAAVRFAEPAPELMLLLRPRELALIAAQAGS